uniref:Structural maintenance of chromosomes protein 6 n=1 Tax=Esox lucius TaxID=8010 RepID=A0A6Q2YU96_ESOLU
YEEKKQVLSDTKLTKKSRLEAVTEEDGREDNGTLFKDHFTSPSGLGDIGVIESITIKNFMCHHSLGPFQFGPNVNFIVGSNGSGKSAILTALIVGLGGKATITNRGVSLRGFVKNGESTADVTVKLRNRGPDAYKGDVYGDSICIEQRISCDGVRTCRLKSKSGHLVSNKKEELTSILDHFNIQVDNPVSILNQEMSKQFLHSKSEADKYKFFMKATLLEQMKRDYIHIKQTKAVTREQVELQEECLKDLKQEFLQKKERYENLSSVGNMKKTLEDLKKMMACVPLFSPKNKVSVAEEKLQDMQSRLESRREEEETLSEDCLKIKEEVKAKIKAQKEQEVRCWVGATPISRKNQLLASRSNKLKRFGDNMPDLLDTIYKAHIQGRFIKKPIGPIGACINLKDPTLAVAVESCLRSFMKTFCCDNYKDEAVLQELMSHYFSKGNRPQIIVSAFSNTVYKVQGRGVNHPDYPSVLDSLIIASPVITNCLIDMRGIESILIIKKHAARKVMQHGRPPRNCREAFTVEGDQVYPNRYYTPDFSTAKYLGGDLETEIRMVESELENYKAQLSRFQQHVRSVTEDIQHMEAQLHSTIMTLKKTLVIFVRLSKCFVAKAKEISPERRKVDRSAKSIDVEITRLRKKIGVQESSHGDHEQVVREYAEALANYRDKSNQVRDLKKFIDRLDNIMSDRQTRYKIMRRSLSVRCKLYFNNFLIKMNCCGSMMFDHNNETLSISVGPPGRENDGMSDMRSLSGGERSFSTVCFILSLWEITESPFRCLDEFDVYMVRCILISTPTIQYIKNMLFVLLSNLPFSNLPESDHIKIHQLQDPERAKGQTGE